MGDSLVGWQIRQSQPWPDIIEGVKKRRSRGGHCSKHSVFLALLPWAPSRNQGPPSSLLPLAPGGQRPLPACKPHACAVPAALQYAPAFLHLALHDALCLLRCSTPPRSCAWRCMTR